MIIEEPAETASRLLDASNTMAIGMIVFNSGISALQRVEQALRLNRVVFLFDNSPWDSKFKELNASDHRCLNYLTCGKNVGLGYGLSSICASAYYKGYESLLFFDQDTVFNDETLRFIGGFSKKHKQLAATHAAVVFSSRDITINTPPAYNFQEVLLARNSGSLFYLRNLSKLNWHNVYYFVDCVDYEFCLRSKIAGLKIAECSVTPGFDHVREQADRRYFLLGSSFQARAYPLRRILGTSFASLKLVLRAIVAAELPVAIAVLRSLAVYLAFQGLVRVLNITHIGLSPHGRQSEENDEKSKSDVCFGHSARSH